MTVEAGCVLQKLQQTASDSDRYFFMKALTVRCGGYVYRNRDFRHMSKMTNGMVADYFYEKLDQKFIKLR